MATKHDNHLRKNYELYLALLGERLMGRAWNMRELEGRVEAQRNSLPAQERAWQGGPGELVEEMRRYLGQITSKLETGEAVFRALAVIRSPTHRAKKDRWEEYRQALLEERARVEQVLEALGEEAQVSPSQRALPADRPAG